MLIQVGRPCSIKLILNPIQELIILTTLNPILILHITVSILVLKISITIIITIMYLIDCIETHKPKLKKTDALHK